MSDAATDAENFAETLDYEVSVIAFESVQARMKLAIDTGDLELIDEIHPELAAAAAAVQAAKPQSQVLN